MKKKQNIIGRVAAVVGVSGLCLASYMTTTMAGPTAWKQVKNNNHIIETQKAANGDPSAKGEVKIDFYGHAAFKMTSPSGLTMLFDPWRNDPRPNDWIV